MCGALCPLWHGLNDHKRVLRHSKFSAYIVDKGNKAFGLVYRDGAGAEHGQLLYQALALYMHNKQWLVLSGALKAKWSLRCEVWFQGVAPSLDIFVARLLQVPEVS